MTKGTGSSIGGYTIESLLGRGGMSTVYIAEDAKLGRKVALKIMSEELSENEAFRSVTSPASSRPRSCGARRRTGSPGSAWAGPRA